MLSENIEKELRRVDGQIQQIEKRMSKSGNFILSCNKNGKSYKWKCRDLDKQSAYIIPRSDHAKAEKLAKDTYYRYLLEDCIKEKKALEHYLKHHALESGKSAKYLSNPEVARLMKVQYRSVDKELEEWANASYPVNTQHEESLTIRSATGRMVRSKSEAIIDMLLQQNNIPHRYEDEFAFNDIILYPDFTIRSPKTGKYFIWEHFGLMDNIGYNRNAFDKLRLYADNGFYPFINLIITSETSEHPLDIELVSNIIEYYFK